MRKKVAKILIVDDESEICEILQQFVESIGFAGVTCHDGIAALQQVAREHFDVILSDIMMPRLDGLGLLRQLNSKKWHKPFILLTGNGTEELSRQALQLGAYDFVHKPFDTKHLKSILQGAVKLSREMTQKASKKPVGGSRFFSEIQHVDFMELILTSDTSLQAKQRFIDQSIDLLTFCKASVANLDNPEERITELGYLLRVMRDTAQKAQACGFFDISAFAAMITECLIYYRSRPERLVAKDIEFFSQIVYFLLKYLKVVDNPKSMQKRLFTLSEKMDILYQSFNNKRKMDKAS